MDDGCQVMAKAHTAFGKVRANNKYIFVFMYFLIVSH